MPTSYEHQIDTILDKFNFHFIRNQIKHLIKSIPISKKGLKEDVLSVISCNQNLQNLINELGLLSLQLNNRQVEILNVIDANTKKALDLLPKTIKLTTTSVITDAFPFPIEDKKKLSGLSSATLYPVLSDTVTMGAETYNRLIVCSVIDKEIEELVPATHLSQEGQQLQLIDTIYTMKRKERAQLFHAIYWCSNLSRLILSVDRNVLSLSVAQDQLFVMRKFLMSKGVDSTHAINVFGAIEPLYNAPDGYITKLGHVTTDGNPVRIPLKSSQKCLKEDHYHQAGEGGGHVHAKFSVAKRWEFTIDGTSRTVDIEVGLIGQPKMLDTAQPLTDFTILKSKRLDDFSFVIDKVLSYIANP